MSHLAGLCLLIFVALTIESSAHAQGISGVGVNSSKVGKDAVSASEPLEIKLVRSRIVLVDGKETRQSADSARPGDILEEVATYTNKSGSVLKSLEATLPVPVNTELVMASVSPGAARASTDGKVYAPVPLRRKVKLDDGRETEQPVPPGEYRYLRWFAGDLRPASSQVFSARFRVSAGNAVAGLQNGGKQ